jgi:hypothetical protein
VAIFDVIVQRRKYGSGQRFVRSANEKAAGKAAAVW